MDDRLIAELIQVLLRSRKTVMQVLGDCEIPFAEFLAMYWLEQNSETSADNVYAYELQNRLFVSKPAISQMLKSLESRGYVHREIDMENRRKQVILLTESGRAMLEKVKVQYSEVFTEIIDTFGKEKVNDMLVLCRAFAEVVEKVTAGKAAEGGMQQTESAVLE